MTSSARAHTIVATSTSAGSTTSDAVEVAERLDRRSPARARRSRRAGGPCPTPRPGPAAVFVDGASNAAGSTMASVPFSACDDSALRSAERYAFLLTFTSNERGEGGNTTPPPVNWAARIVPARARPVPFWRHGLPRPPETSPRLFAARVPARCAFSSARTASCTRCGFTSTAKTASSSVTCFVPPSVGAFGAAITSAPDLDDAVLRARDGALDEQQVLLRLDRVHGEPDLRDALAAHPAGHADALEDARGRRRGADRARLADVVRAVRDRAAAEVVALDRAGEALADADAGDLDRVAGLEAPRR